MMNDDLSLDARDCLAAIALAERVLAGRMPQDGPFKLIGVANLLKGHQPPSGPSVWELTFKPTRLIPRDAADPVGAGGEWVVRVDLSRDDNPVTEVRGD